MTMTRQDAPVIRGLSEGARAALMQRVEGFVVDAVRPAASDIDLRNRFFPELLEAGAELGLMRLHLTDDLQVDVGNTLLIHEITERIASASAAVATVMATQRLTSYLLARWANGDLRERWVESTTRARTFGSFALTEPGAGSDIRGISTVARREGGDFLLNGDKCWVGNAPIADYAIVLAKLDRDDRDADTVALVVDMTSPGAERGRSPELSGLRGLPNGTLSFRDVRVPAENMLAVEGFRGMMNGLNMARIEVVSYCCGLLRGAIEASVERAASRRAFDQLIGDMPSIQMKIGRMVTDYYASRQFALRAAESYIARDGGDQDVISMAKMFASDAARHHTGEAVQIFGASGIPLAADVNRMNRDAKIQQIFDGTSEIHETMLGRRAVRQFQRGGMGVPFLPAAPTPAAS